MFNLYKRLENIGAFWAPPPPEPLEKEMPRSRRRHHSRSRSRSRSHSHERDREPKRRKIDGIDSPLQKRSVSTDSEPPKNEDLEMSFVEETPNHDKSLKDNLQLTPTRTMSPKQHQKRLESETKRKQKQTEREEREKKRLEEKEKQRIEKEQQRLEKIKEKELKDEQKRKEREEKEEVKRKEKEEREELKRKEREEKESKRKEKEEREEQKRKEREQEKLKKQQELDEKNKEKQKAEEQKQKAAAAFVNFFVPKKVDLKLGDDDEKQKNTNFMPFQIKSDMKLAPQNRRNLSTEEKNSLTETIEEQDNSSYIFDLKQGKKIGRDTKTWPLIEDADEVILVEEDFGEEICEEVKAKSVKMRAKYLKFHDNRRPAYFGTWRKKSKIVTARKPFAEEKCFDYEYESDDDWEEEEQGESLENGSDDEEKENEVDNDEYEVDNDFFVPHGHLSDDEVDDETDARLSPESQKQKLKLLKDEFDEDMQAKTNRMKPRSIGCVWYSKDGAGVDEAIDRHLKPFAMLMNGRILIKKRLDSVAKKVLQSREVKKLGDEHVPVFLKLIHGNTSKGVTIVKEFLLLMENNGCKLDLSKKGLLRTLREFAEWRKCTEKGIVFNKMCWLVKEEAKKNFNVDFSLECK